MHFCHANGCIEEAHREVPFCKPHFQMLPEPHRKKLWEGRPKGRCGACEPLDDASDRDQPKRADDWNSLLNLGVAIIAVAEAPEYEPPPECVDEQGFCWVGGIHDAIKTVKTARTIIQRFNIQAPS